LVGDGAEGAVPCQGALQLGLVQRLALGRQFLLGGGLVVGLGALLEVALQLRLVQRLAGDLVGLVVWGFGAGGRGRPGGGGGADQGQAQGQGGQRLAGWTHGILLCESLHKQSGGRPFRQRYGTRYR
jgi:hypothetical protein